MISMEQKKTHLRIPPNNTEAERALLGSIMLRPEVMFEITDLTHSSSFYSERHRLIFETMLELFSKRNPTDLLTVSARLKEKNLLEETGGNTYLGQRFLLRTNNPKETHRPQFDRSG